MLVSISALFVSYVSSYTFKEFICLLSSLLTPTFTSCHVPYPTFTVRKGDYQIDDNRIPTLTLKTHHMLTPTFTARHVLNPIRTARRVPTPTFPDCHIHTPSHYCKSCPHYYLSCAHSHHYSLS